MESQLSPPASLYPDEITKAINPLIFVEMRFRKKQVYIDILQHNMTDV